MAKARRTRTRAEIRLPRPSRRPPEEVPPPAPVARPVALPRTPPAQRIANPDAVRLYEHGVDALQRRAFADAATRLRDLISNFPDERELHERARVYLRVCERELASSPPKMSIEDRVMAATVAVNSGDYSRARALLDNIIRERPDNDLAEYMFAVVAVAVGEAEAAIPHLERAISLNPENRSLARQDDDFQMLHNRDDFRRLIESQGQGRRRRQRPR
jgi:tetratricopeptide (TPR) repeat protein